jgi:hypothetical protein
MDAVSIAYSTGGPQLVDRNPVEAATARLSHTHALARTEHKPFSVKPKRQRKHGFRLPLRITLARPHLHGGCRPRKGSLHRLNVKVPHSMEDEADSGDAIVLELQRSGTHQRASTGQIVSRVILTLAKDVRACGTPKQVPSE